MTYQDPNELLERWEMNPRAITMDEVIRQMLQIMCGMHERLNKEQPISRSEFTAVENAVIALEKGWDTLAEEIEESVSEDLNEILDTHMQIVQQDILKFGARFKANEDEIRLLRKELKGMHPTAELFILELATAFNTFNRLMARSQQTAFVLGGRRADLFQKRADAEDVKRDTDGQADDIPPDKSSQE